MIWIVLADPRERPNQILLTTKDREKAFERAFDYLKDNNMGEGDVWENIVDLSTCMLDFDNYEEFVLHFSNNALVHPTVIETRLE